MSEADSETDLPIFGFREHWPVARARYESLIGFIDRVLERGTQSVLGNQPESPLGVVTHYICHSNINSLMSLVVLIGNGLGIDAFRILRSMLEAQATAEFLRLRPENLNDYIDYEHVFLKRLLDFMEQGNTTPVLDPARSAEVVSAYREVAHRFQNPSGSVRQQWCKQQIRQIFEVAGMLGTYDSMYAIASSLHHVSSAGLTRQIEPGTAQLPFAPQVGGFDGEVLHQGTGAFIGCLRSYALIESPGAVGIVESLLQEHAAIRTG